MDNATAHHRDLDDDFPDGFDFFKEFNEYQTPNTTPLLQPMDQQVIPNFKNLNTRALFRKCSELTNDTQLIHKEYCKDHFTFLKSLTLIDNAWTQETYRTHNSAWKKPWPDSVAEGVLEGFESDDCALNDEVVFMGKVIGLDVESEDVHELLKSHEIEL